MRLPLVPSAALALALSLGLVGCGGGGIKEGMSPDANNMTPPDPGPAGGLTPAGTPAPPAK